MGAMYIRLIGVMVISLIEGRSASAIRGVAYGALPLGDKHASEDMMQIGYKAQWGTPGRNDLGVMKDLGANAVRLYHSLGINTMQDHSAFLDHAEKMEMDVMPGVHTYLHCPGFDCFATWKNVTKAGFKVGFAKQGSWHPAVSVLILQNEPDFKETGDDIKPKGYNYLRAVVSALDGVLAAEREAGVAPGRVRLTAAWSFAVRIGINGKSSGVSNWGFKDFASVVKDPSIVNYTPITPQKDFELAFQRRWINCVNVQAGYSYVKGAIGSRYEEAAGAMPWFIGEYGALWNSGDEIERDLKAMDADARNGSNPFMGSAFFQFQTSYRKGFGTERNFGLFSLGAKIHQTGEVCDAPLFGHLTRCANFSVQCLSTNLDGFKLPSKANHRAQAVARAWGGSLTGPGICHSQPPAPSPAPALVPAPAPLPRAPSQAPASVPTSADAPARTPKLIGKGCCTPSETILGAWHNLTRSECMQRCIAHSSCGAFAASGCSNSSDQTCGRGCHIYKMKSGEAPSTRQCMEVNNFLGISSNTFCFAMQ